MLDGRWQMVSQQSSIIRACDLASASCNKHVKPAWFLQVFASTSGTTFFWYIPVKEYKDIDTTQKTCNLVTCLGPLMTSFSGAYSVLSSQEMEFKFNKLVISVFGRTLVARPVSFKEKQYTYYWLQGNLACARSSGGGVVLLNRTAPLPV